MDVNDYTVVCNVTSPVNEIPTQHTALKTDIRYRHYTGGFQMETILNSFLWRWAYYLLSTRSGMQLLTTM